jgi:hypothetical protein
LEEDGENSKGTEVPSSLVKTNLKYGGEGEPMVEKSSRISSLNQFTTSCEASTSKFSNLSSFNWGGKEEYSTGKSPRSNFLGVSTKGKRGALFTATSVLKVESGNFPVVPEIIAENPS